MIITEFIEGRNVKINTVSNYISRHEDLFTAHVKKYGKYTDLDDEAVRILDKKYPLEKKAVVVNGVPHEEYEALQKDFQKLANKLQEVMEKYNVLVEEKARLEVKEATSQALLEMKEQQVEDVKEKADQLQQELSSFEKTIFGLYKKTST